MENIDTMQSALELYVINPLSQNGFTGKYPHFQKKHPDRIELINFQINKWGSSFIIEISTVFPGKKNNNYLENIEINDYDRYDIQYTSERYRLPGIYNGWFYYTDVYRKFNIFFGMLYATPRNNDEIFEVKRKGYKLFQKFNENTAINICVEINKQMKSAYKWWRNIAHKNI